jgi:hypothetical protein
MAAIAAPDGSLLLSAPNTAAAITATIPPPSPSTAIQNVRIR